MKKVLSVCAIIFCALAGTAMQLPSIAPDSRVFELRTYTATPGKFEALHARWRDHTVALFKKHGFNIVGFWVPIETPPGSPQKLVYLLSFKDRASADAAWKAFRADPEWQSVLAESQRDGSLTSNIDDVFMKATDYSPMK
jgi:hypothetical protein